VREAIGEAICAYHGVETIEALDRGEGKEKRQDSVEAVTLGDDLELFGDDETTARATHETATTASDAGPDGGEEPTTAASTEDTSAAETADASPSETAARTDRSRAAGNRARDADDGVGDQAGEETAADSDDHDAAADGSDGGDEPSAVAETDETEQTATGDPSLPDDPAAAGLLADEQDRSEDELAARIEGLEAAVEEHTAAIREQRRTLQRLLEALETRE
jgi:hypothetical protein